MMLSTNKRGFHWTSEAHFLHRRKLTSELSLLNGHLEKFVSHSELLADFLVLHFKHDAALRSSFGNHGVGRQKVSRGRFLMERGQPWVIGVIID